MADQSIATQLRRLKAGRCPIHGYGFGQDEGYKYDIDGNNVGEGGGYCIASCQSKGCPVKVTAKSAGDVAKLIAPTLLVERLESTRS